MGPPTDYFDLGSGWQQIGPEDNVHYVCNLRGFSLAVSCVSSDTAPEALSSVHAFLWTDASYEWVHWRATHVSCSTTDLSPD